MDNFNEERNDDGELTEKSIENHVNKVQTDKRMIAQSVITD
jgi:hypothetical protein